ncbi:MAG: AbiTii domain-containing protein [Candidatus Methylomirabilia bacterium]
MSLLDEIREDAVNGQIDISTLLRKCRVLAARLKNEEFRAWVQNELDGYPPDAPLPDYRQDNAQSLGHFVGPFGSGARNAPIPMGCIPEQYHEYVSEVKFTEGVGALQSIVSKSGNKSLQMHWPADLVAAVSQGIYQNMTLMQAWKVISPSTISGIIDTVRNRVLNFVLEIESKDPNAGEGKSSPSLSSETVGNVFNTYIMGNVTNLAAGSPGTKQIALTSIHKNDLDSLGKFLEQQGVQGSDIADLKKSLAAEPKVESKSFGKRVAGWLGTMVAKAAQGVWAVSTTTASDVLTKALKKYYGLE